MRRRLLLVFAAIVVMSASTAVRSASGATSATGTTGNYIVVLKDSVGDPGLVASQQAAKFAAKVGFVYAHALKGYSVTMPTALVPALQADSRVAYVAPDEPVHMASQFVTNEIRRIQADQSSTRSGDGSGSVNINVAVIDSGIDATHPDLNVVGGVDCVNPKDRNFSDDEGHGTFVAGLIGARDNAIGVVGVAPGARLWAVKVLKKNNTATNSTILCGIDWVTGTRTDADTTNDIPVANMSIGSSPHSKSVDDGNCGLTNKDAFHQGICASVAAGVTYVISAGNETVDVQYEFPAAYDEVLTVTAMGDFDGQPGGLGTVGPNCQNDFAGKVLTDDAAIFFSNFATLASDQAHTLSAPGVCDVSTYPLAACATRKNPPPTECYARGSGTSFSAPLVAGTVALCIANGPCAGLTPAQIIQKMVTDAQAYNTANPGYGFTGDPIRPVTGKYYGYLIHAGSY